MLKLLSSKYSAFIGIALLSFGCYLDYTIVNIALPVLEREFNATLIELQWVMNVYFLALCVLATLMGRLGDLLGLRFCFYLGAAIFALASFIAGVAPTIDWLIFGRLLQGIGAAIVFPLGLSLLPHSFLEHERSRAIAYLASLGGIALALGPILGGIIVESWGWEWIFLINIPIILIGFLFCFTSIKKIPVLNHKINCDWKGAFCLCIALSTFVLGLVQSHSDDMQLSTFIYCAIGIIFGILFIYIEKNQSDPLVDLNDFKKPLFLCGGLLVFSAGIFSAVILFFAPLYLQTLRGFSSLTASWILFAIPFAVFIMALFTDKIIARAGLLNTILFAFSMALLSFGMQLFFSENSTIIYMIIAFTLLGAMWALSNTAPVIAAQSSVAPDRAASATGTMITLFNIGGALGLAIAVTLFSFYSSFMQGFSAIILFLFFATVLMLGICFITARN